MIKKMLITVLTTALLVSVSAQNARVQALGGCDIMDDIFGLIGNPADMNDYQNQVQATAYSATSFGPGIGLLGLGNNITVGLLALPVQGNGSGMLMSNFYNDAKAVVDAPGTAGNLAAAFPTIPHLLFGMKLGELSLGLDFFVEMTRYTSNRENATSGQAIINDTSKVISNIGALLSANLAFGSLSLSPMVGFSLPKAKGVFEVNAPTASKVEIETEAGLMVTGGVEAGLEVKSFNLIAGGFVTYEPYQFDIDGVLSDELKNTFINGYVGLVTEILNKVLLVSQYNLDVGLAKVVDNNDTSGTDVSATGVAHTLRMGMEKPLDGFWIFDEMTPRLGFQYSVDGLTAKFENSGGLVNTGTINAANAATQVALTTGLGFRKGIAQIDIGLIFGSWTGVLTGPSVATGTLTLDFGKSGGSSDAPAYEVPSYEKEPEKEEEKKEEEQPKEEEIEFDF